MLDRLRVTVTAGLVLGLALSLPSGLSAQAMGLWDCVGRAVHSNPQVGVGRWRVTEAGRVLDESATRFRPDFRLYGNYSLNSYVPEISFPGRSIRLGDHDEVGLTVQADYLLYDWGRRRNNLEADRRQMESAGLSLGSMRQELAYRSGTAFLTLQGARNEQTVAESAVKIYEAHLVDLQALLDNGMLTGDEVLNGEVRLDQARVRLSRAANQVRLSRVELLLAMGLPLDSDVAFADTAYGVPQPPEGGYSLEASLAARPDFTQYQVRAAALELRSAALQSDTKPTVQVFVSGTAGKPGIDQFRNETIEYARAGVSFNWPLWDWRRTDYRRAQVDAEREATLSERIVLAGRIALELERSRLEAAEVRDRLELTRKTLQAAEEHFRLLGDRFDQGRATNTEYLDAEEQLTVSRLDHLHAGIELELAQWRLAWVSGRLFQELHERWPELPARADITADNKK